MRDRRKRVRIGGGGEEGFSWALTLNIYENTKSFTGYFGFSGELRKLRKQARSRDRKFFEARLGTKYMSEKVLHHLWVKNSSTYTKVVLSHKSEHSNGGIDVSRDRTAWIEKEEWL